MHTGLRRGSLFHLRWDYVDFLNRVVRIPRSKSGRPHALPLNATVLTTLQALYTERMPDCPYVFAHATGRQAGQPVKDVKNGFHRPSRSPGSKTSPGTICATVRFLADHEGACFDQWPSSLAIAACAWSCGTPISRRRTCQRKWVCLTRQLRLRRR